MYCSEPLVNRGNHGLISNIMLIIHLHIYLQTKSKSLITVSRHDANFVVLVTQKLS